MLFGELALLLFLLLLLFLELFDAFVLEEESLRVGAGRSEVLGVNVTGQGGVDDPRELEAMRSTFAESGRCRFG